MEKNRTDQFLVPSKKERQEAIDKIDNPDLREILTRHLPNTSQKKEGSRGENNSPHLTVTEGNIKDAIAHEKALLRGIPPEDR